MVCADRMLSCASKKDVDVRDKSRGLTFVMCIGRLCTRGGNVTTGGLYMAWNVTNPGEVRDKVPVQV